MGLTFYKIVVKQVVDYSSFANGLTLMIFNVYVSVVVFKYGTAPES